LEGDPVGQRIKFGNSDVPIGGVVKDYVFSQMRSAIEPLVLTVWSDTASVWSGQQGGCLLAKIGAHTNIPTVIDAIRKVYRQYDRQTAFEYSFADEAFDSLYKAEDRLAGLMGGFTFITILIACLGLFGLATFSAQQRVREIGIRKVLGASISSIGMLLSRDFLRPVLVAVVIACPLSWWAMHRWLEDFAYRTTLSWWVFAASGLGLLLVALATVLMRSLRAGRANPVDNLRSE
jgi:putative ABC transport system permease protein